MATGIAVFKEEKARKAKPGYYGRSFGFDSDVIRPKHNPNNDTTQTSNPPPIATYLGIKGVNGVPIGSLIVKCAIKKPVTNNENECFKVQAEFTVNGKDYEYGGLNFTYQDESILDKISPDFCDSSTFTASHAYVPNTESISDHGNA